MGKENGSTPSGVKGKVELMHIIERLKTQTRTGWVNVKVPGRVESIADHMYRMAVLSLLSEEDEELDIAKCVQMAVVHDLAEALVGDITPHDGISKAEKQKLEEDAMHKMTQENLNPDGPASKRIRALFEEYEQRSTKEARFVKDLDLLEMALQGSEYEADRGSNQIQPFFKSSIPKIQHPEVKKWAHELMQQRQARRANDSTYKHVDISERILADKPTSAIPTPSPLIQLSPSSVPVVDADEEIFDLYTHIKSLGTQHVKQVNGSTTAAANPPEKHVGLGFVDPKKNTLHISIEIPKASLPTSPTSRNRARAKRRPSLPQAGPSSSTARRQPDKTKAQESDTLEIEVQQDLGGLHARKGDTGSVVWQASVLFATFVLQEAALMRNSLFMPDMLKHAKVLELGAGTGVLSTLLAPLVDSWTATDMAELLPLIQKNHKVNNARLSAAKVEVQELDWTWTPQQFQKNARTIASQHYDVVFAVDCLYNEALVQPFVDTINRIKSTYVVIVSELRSVDVMQLFLERWLASGPWTIHRPARAADSSDLVASEEIAQPGLLGHQYIIWAGWKKAA